MRSLDVHSTGSMRFSPRHGFTRFGNAVAAALIATSGLTGCDKASSPELTTMPSGIVVPRTPEEKLDQVMVRMRSALEDAQAASGTGVVSERTCDHRLIPPTSEGGKYTAEVTIRTKLSLANVPAAATLPPPKGKEDEEAEEEADNSTADEGEEGEDGEERRPDNGASRKAIALSREYKEDVYQLAYEDNRWKLLTEPKGETEKLVLEYALKL